METILGYYNDGEKFFNAFYQNFLRSKSGKKMRYKNFIFTNLYQNSNIKISMEGGVIKIIIPVDGDHPTLITIYLDKKQFSVEGMD